MKKTLMKNELKKVSLVEITFALVQMLKPKERALVWHSIPLLDKKVSSFSKILARMRKPFNNLSENETDLLVNKAVKWARKDKE